MSFLRQIVDLQLLPDFKEHPILFEEIYYKAGSRPLGETIFEETPMRFLSNQNQTVEKVWKNKSELSENGQNSVVSEEEKRTSWANKFGAESFYNTDFIVGKVENKPSSPKRLGFKRSLMMPSVLNNFKVAIHLIFLVHGFQGRSLDMSLLKNSISLFYPDVQCHIVTSIEKSSERSIQELADLLAEEVVQVIRDNHYQLADFKMSFIGHSLGGIVIRAALPKLERYSRNMCSYISLCSPHIGCRNNKSKVVEMALWVIKKLRKQEALDQLCMTDHEDLEKTFMYGLSQAKGLEWFKHMALCSSYQDTFSPYESSRVQIGDKLSKNSKEIKVFHSMANNILSRLKISKLYRMDIDFEIKKYFCLIIYNFHRSFGKMVGRVAHIAFIDNAPVIYLIITQLQHLINLDSFAMSMQV